MRWSSVQTRPALGSILRTVGSARSRPRPGRRRVRRLGRNREGGVRPQWWPFGDRPFYGSTPDLYPYGYWGSIRWGRLLALVLVWGLGLFAIMVVVAVLLG